MLVHTIRDEYVGDGNDNWLVFEIEELFWHMSREGLNDEQVLKTIRTLQEEFYKRKQYD